VTTSPALPNPIPIPDHTRSQLTDSTSAHLHYLHNLPPTQLPDRKADVPSSPIALPHVAIAKSRQSSEEGDPPFPRSELPLQKGRTRGLPLTVRTHNRRQSSSAGRPSWVPWTEQTLQRPGETTDLSMRKDGALRRTSIGPMCSVWCFKYTGTRKSPRSRVTRGSFGACRFFPVTLHSAGLCSSLFSPFQYAAFSQESFLPCARDPFTRVDGRPHRTMIARLSTTPRAP
jgi:hypothetical protein